MKNNSWFMSRSLEPCVWWGHKLWKLDLYWPMCSKYLPLLHVGTDPTKLPSVHVSVPVDDSVYPLLQVNVTSFVFVTDDVAPPSTRPLSGAVAVHPNRSNNFILNTKTATYS